ncbi:MAG: DUF6933 domain-containing protein [Cyclobacteriaceae bacterium]|jgi:hypothetical protein
MTKIYCSHKLKDFLGQKYFTSTEDSVNPYGDWNAHLFYYDGRKNVILVNNKSYYSVFLIDIKKADFKDFSTLFFNRLTEQLQYDKVIGPTDVLITIQKYAPLHFARTNNDKKTIGTINDFVFQYEVRKEHDYWFDKNLLEYNSSINDSLTGAGRTSTSDYGRPIPDMQNLLNTSP